MVKVEKKEGESNDSLIRRFSGKVQKTGILKTAKGALFFRKKPNKRQKKDSALRRKQNREQREFDIKTGRIQEAPQYGHHSKRKAA